ncbi:heterokaryon incompatibility protein-domain-containing protein [Penicillium odoratum]|uniref:heterokaryon incompatibility protein-domain-containing protein n=1 Tax=Penicillium odoratum TaxID=1167516 RepID=UPI0025496F5F|nr:heterokaryon incompatibility protein-domain-containing protein [Penicillium odoratum]KAJ5746484.1 heterokaryon incompatibility protein-domain-containing protein [Penicillium odoratum]
MIQSSSLITDSLVGTGIPTYGLSKEDAEQIRVLQAQSSELCARCSSLDILALFLKSQPLDILQRKELRDSPSFFNDLNHRIHLGSLSSIFLSPSCPFCRLLYCILPRKPASGRTRGGALKYAQRVGETNPEIYLTPARTYLRSFGWETLPDSDRKQYAVVLALEESRYSTNEIIRSTPSAIADSPDVQYASLDGPLIAMENRFMGPDRDVSNFRLVESKPETAEIRQALDDCLQNHTGTCRVEKSEELVTIRVVDVIERVIVPYPAGSDYAALSYVWGGISPSPGALENGCLPLTVEDAITVTKSLGIRYLWVLFTGNDGESIRWLSILFLRSIRCA